MTVLCTAEKPSVSFSVFLFFSFVTLLVTDQFSICSGIVSELNPGVLLDRYELSTTQIAHGSQCALDNEQGAI